MVKVKPALLTVTDQEIQIMGGKMKVLKIVLPLVLAMGLVVGIAVPSLARPETVGCQAEDYQDRHGPQSWGRILPQIQAGKVIGIDEGQSYFIIQRGEEEPAEIAVDDNTKYFKVPALRRIAGLLQNRLSLRNQNQVGASDFNPAEPARLRLTNANGLRKMKGYDQLVSRPMAGPAVTQARLMRNGRGFNQAASPTMAAAESASVVGGGAGGDGQPNIERFGQEATFNDINIGDRVAVRLVPDQDKPLAKLVLIFEQASYDYEKIAGTITSVSPDNQTITIEPGNGDGTVTLGYNDETVFYLKGAISVAPGQLASAVYHAEDMMAKVVRVWLEGAE